MKKNLKIYFTRIYIIKAFVIAIALSGFIYLSYFNITIKALNTLLAIAGFYLILGQHRVVWFWSGFFIGIMWFYWIGFSFVYYDLSFMIPFVILGIALVYGFLFWFIGRFATPIYLQLLCLFGISFIDPFGFNWLKFPVIFVDTYFDASFLAFGCFLIALGMAKMFQKWLKLAAFIPCFFALSLSSAPTKPELLNVSLPTMNVPQSQRWDKKYQKAAIELNIQLIEQAIAEKKEMIILPESAFPLYLNLADGLVETLKAYSDKITIVAGSLTYEENQGFFNSSYLFHQGQMQVAHKIILVPFGEEVPFPSFIVEVINKLFFDGAKDYQKAKEPQDFSINGVLFRSAICYEATTDKLFENNPKQMIVISNNAWFTPSTEQTLQHLLLRYYAKKYQTVIYHSANSGISGIIVP